MLISELYLNKKNYLYEGLNTKSLKSVMLWENAGHKIIEAQLTPNQVLQIFQQAEQGASAAGGNRTLVGKGKDAVTAVNQAWEDLKTKVQNSGPIKNVDAMYDQAAEKLKQATGGDTGVMQYVQKYRDFAKKHPVAQSLIYSALIAAAGISGAGLGGAAALGLFKMVDKLLQGEKFSSAAYSGAKTGAAAYAAGQIGQSMQGGGNFSGTDTWQSLDGINKSTIENGKIVGDIIIKNQVYSPGSSGYAEALKIATKHAADGNMLGTTKAFKTAASQAVQNLGKDSFGSFKESYTLGTALTEGQVSKIFALAIAAQLNEGIMDTIKGAASGAVNKASQWLQTKGHNLTTKVTADKLAQAWEKAGSPMDSDSVASILKAQGVADDVIADVYGQMKLPVPAPAATTTSAAQTPSTTATTSAAQTPSTTATTTAQPGQIDKLLATLSDYISQGGSITPKQRGAFVSLWKQMGGTQIAENKRKKKNSP